MQAIEFNFDGIVGPTHNYAGLAFGNLASATHGEQTSNPRAAALQGLDKMLKHYQLGLGQAVLPPPLRPRLDVLRRCGFSGDSDQIIKDAAQKQPILLACVYSAASMWVANAATVSPSMDCADARLHLTTANLNSSLHRAIEVGSTHHVLSQIFSSGEHFAVHPALPSCDTLADEGAANHTRLCSDHGHPGIEIFTFGRAATDRTKPRPSRFPARQTLEACQSIARLHGLDPANTFFVQQAPQAIDAGVFHNDVISVGNQNLLLIHELAWNSQSEMLTTIASRFEELTNSSLHIEQISQQTLPLNDAISSYLFNSQLLTLENGDMMLACPHECQTNVYAQNTLRALFARDNPIKRIEYFDLKQSMDNGGGPACLRLRIVMNDTQFKAMHEGIVFNERLYERLGNCIVENYREALSPHDLADPNFVHEAEKATQALYDILNLTPYVAV
ncbi:MAG TPA: N-succinylarginine dihydrolase [Pirellulaceae bacterium]|nr:N-succinylarginine dihydrolase [Pirellulaceae bacterium]HMO92948.1 N-succinylarginine dihydrolase [Pirellulaceae bacterium]HMP68487.1 N-succinylarginine dihydrolase [Pirellulaceae bacterium]